ncbi:hypothetical protein GCM10027447_02560 [Glycomyces halotolerans]
MPLYGISTPARDGSATSSLLDMRHRLYPQGRPKTWGIRAAHGGAPFTWPGAPPPISPEIGGGAEGQVNQTAQHRARGPLRSSGAKRPPPISPEIRDGAEGQVNQTAQHRTRDPLRSSGAKRPPPISPEIRDGGRYQSRPSAVAAD